MGCRLRTGYGRHVSKACCGRGSARASNPSGLHAAAKKPWVRAAQQRRRVARPGTSPRSNGEAGSAPERCRAVTGKQEVPRNVAAQQSTVAARRDFGAPFLPALLRGVFPGLLGPAGYWMTQFWGSGRGAVAGQRCSGARVAGERRRREVSRGGKLLVRRSRSPHPTRYLGRCPARRPWPHRVARLAVGIRRPWGRPGLRLGRPHRLGSSSHWNRRSSRESPR